MTPRYISDERRRAREINQELACLAVGVLLNGIFVILVLVGAWTVGTNLLRVLL
jgi:hypothetical protein